MDARRYLPRELPESLGPLTALALDLRRSWSNDADLLWTALDPTLWKATQNPSLILEALSASRIEELAGDHAFQDRLRGVIEARERSLAAPGWVQSVPGWEALGRVAYFCMEFGLSEALPIYSGGLGLLAGDHLKTASDLGVPVVGIGLLYQQGYFRQALDARGDQVAYYPYNAPTMLPVVPLRDADQSWIHVTVDLPGRAVELRTWQVEIGRVRLLLLDANDPLNRPGDRALTAELYGGGPEVRLGQEIVLGIGGWRLLERLGGGVDVCHLNEGHAAFVVLARAYSFQRRAHCDFATALRATRAGNLFTTHTAVEAGFDRYAPELMVQYLGGLAGELGLAANDLLALGRADPNNHAEPFNLAYLAIRGAGQINAVSALHGVVSRRLLQPIFPRLPPVEVPVTHVTNGVHVPTWNSRHSEEVWAAACGETPWAGATEGHSACVRSLDDDTLWTMRGRARRDLVSRVRQRLAQQRAACGDPPDLIAASERAMDPDVLTLGFARRFATYKRPTLLLRDPARLVRLVTDRERPLQIVVAGKAHPADREGAALVRAWAVFARDPAVRDRVVFLEDHDMALAGELVGGVDLWLNTPRRPWEASGTSGMKVLVNGGLNLSQLDGWWSEAYRPDVGWALGDGAEHDSSGDPVDAEQLYWLLEHEVVPLFYERDSDGLPRTWISRMRESMASLTPPFSSNRMVREYTERLYLPAAAAVKARTANGGALAAELELWRSHLDRHWGALRFGAVAVQTADGCHHVEVQIYLNELAPEALRVELYADPVDADGAPERHQAQRGAALVGASNAFVYHLEMPATRPATDYTARVLPHHPAAILPLEAPHVLWHR
jgi:glycogen phosphorylase